METLDLQLGSRSGSIRPQLFGHFIEFIENCIQGGIYDPGSPSSDEHGIRQDVLEKAQALRPTLLRLARRHLFRRLSLAGQRRTHFRTQKTEKPNLGWDQ